MQTEYITHLAGVKPVVMKVEYWWELGLMIIPPVSKIRKNIYWSDIQVTFQLTLISYVHRSFIPNKTAFTKYCLTQWISKLPRSFDIQWVRYDLVNFRGQAGIINATLYKTKPIFTALEHGKLSLSSRLPRRKTIHWKSYHQFVIEDLKKN